MQELDMHASSTECGVRVPPQPLPARTRWGSPPANDTINDRESRSRTAKPPPIALMIPPPIRAEPRVPHPSTATDGPSVSKAPGRAAPSHNGRGGRIVKPLAGDPCPIACTLACLHARPLTRPLARPPARPPARSPASSPALSPANPPSPTIRLGGATLQHQRRTATGMPTYWRRGSCAVGYK